MPHFIKGKNNGWLPWASNLAYLGFAVVALTFLRIIVTVPVESDAFVQSDELSQFVIGWDNFHVYRNYQMVSR